ncbi:MAG: molybdopterin-dependent oxidoreductase [Candidatus Nanopelagicales bacterium]
MSDADSGGRAPAGARNAGAPWLLAGVAATAVAVGTAELLAWFLGPAGSPLTAVGGWVIDWTPAPVKDAAIAAFGTGDKAFLMVVMLVMLALIGCGIGLALRRSLRLANALLGLLGLVGVVAAVTRTPTPSAAITPIIGTGVGIIALAFLRRKGLAAADAPAPATASSGQQRQGMPRRQFVLTALVVTAAGLGAGVLGRVASAAARAASSVRETLKLPPPATSEPIPAGAELRVPGAAPFVTPTKDFYRIDTALSVPTIDAASWSLRIHGLVDRELTLSFDDLLRRPLIERVVTLMCVSNEVGGNLVGNAVWTGVPIRDLLAEVGVRPEADMVLSTSQDRFTAGTPLDTLTDPRRDALLAVSMNGEPLPFEHGYPVRMVVPGLYGYVSATKWVVDLEVTRFDRAQGYWTPRGWSARGPIKLSSRIEVPAQGATRPLGEVVVAGTAWAQHTGISAVQVSIDGGPWREADLGEVPSSDTWRQWVYRWTDATAGRHRIQVRAVDTKGRVQDAVQRPTAPDGATGLHERTITIT